MDNQKSPLIDDCEVYVVHAPKGYESHAQHIRQHFDKQGIPFEFVSEENFASGRIGVSDFDKYFTQGLIDHSSKGALFCTLSHIAAYYKLIASNKKFALMFEDDAWLAPHFSERLEKMHSEVAALPPGFLISLENTYLKYPSFFQSRKGKYLYKASVGRMAGGYIIDRAGAKRCIEYLEAHKCGDIIDLWHNKLRAESNLTIYWAHPTVVEQGSHNGKMFAGISSRPASSSRRVIWYLTKFYKMCFRRFFNQKRIIED